MLVEFIRLPAGEIDETKVAAMNSTTRQGRHIRQSNPQGRQAFAETAFSCFMAVAAVRRTIAMFAAGQIASGAPLSEAPGKDRNSERIATNSANQMDMQRYFISR